MQAVAFCMQLYQHPPPPLGRESGSETSMSPEFCWARSLP